MKKLFLIILLSLVILSPLFNVAQAADPTDKRLVPCGGIGQERCELIDFFQLLRNVFNEITLKIATPLAGLLIVIGGVMMVVSMGKPSLIERGKQMIIYSAVAWVIIFTSWIIIDTVLRAIGAASLPT